MIAAENMHARVLSINSVRIDRTNLVRLLDGLDRAAGEVPRNRRQTRRVNWRIRNAIVFPLQNDRSVAFLVPTRNLSADGMAFLHGQMMHVGRTIGVQLPARGGGWMLVNATVVRCRHVHAMMHEIGLHFEDFVEMSKIYGARPISLS